MSFSRQQSKDPSNAESQAIREQPCYPIPGNSQAINRVIVGAESPSPILIGVIAFNPSASVIPLILVRTERALSVTPYNGRLYIQLGRAFAKANKPNRARRAYQEALEIDPCLEPEIRKALEGLEKYYLKQFRKLLGKTKSKLIGLTRRSD